MRPVDQFKRTPARRYDLKPKEEGKIQHQTRFSKRYFDIPVFDRGDRNLAALKMGFCILLILFFCNASVPLSEVPTVQERFTSWAEEHNRKVVEQLPGNTPEPGTEQYAAVHFDQDAQKEQIEEKIEVQATAAPVVVAAQSETSQFKSYEPGSLRYETERLRVAIEQKKKDGMTYFVCDIQMMDVSQLRSAFAGDDFRSGIYEAVSDIAMRYSPVLAINADFCRYHRNGVIIRNGELKRKQNITKHHLMIVDENGDFSALTDRSEKQGVVADRLVRQNTWQTFEFGPVLVQNGEAAKLPNSFYVNCHDGYYEPRTAIGQIGPLHYIVIVVDGRREGYSTGATIPQLQQLFLDEGAQFAFNLDGGGSTTLYFLGEVINMPAGGKERSVSDIIMFMPNPS